MGNASTGPPAQSPDYYEILEIPRDSSPEAIRAAWHAACFRFHPDSRGGDSPDPARLQAAREAFHTLSDPEARARYDAEHRRWRPRRGRPADPPILSLENIRANCDFLSGQVRRLARSVWKRLCGGPGA